MVNQNFYDATVYLVVAGTRRRLGTVGGNSRETFEFRWEPTDVRFDVDFIGGAAIRTEEMPVNPGDWLVLTITPEAHRLDRRP